jgi:hypothetical protein
MALHRPQAIDVLEAGQAELDGLFNQLDVEQLSRPSTIGGGWAAKDLMGHIAFWEELALDTVDAVRGGLKPRVDGVETDQLNAENQAEQQAQSTAELRSRAASAHEAILAAIQSLSEAEWNAPLPWPDAREPTLGDLLGGVLGAPDRPFGHAYAHLDDLRAYVASAAT